MVLGQMGLEGKWADDLCQSGLSGKKKRELLSQQARIISNFFDGVYFQSFLFPSCEVT